MTIHRLVLFSFLILGMAVQCSTLFAADKPVKYKTLLADARAAIKARRDQAKAEERLLAVIGREDITPERQAEIYFTAQELERSLQSAENMKLYLRQSYDTLRLFSTVLRMHQHLMACDSVEQQPDAQGRVRLRHRQKSRDIMLRYRSDLLNGGKFLLRKAQYAQAFPYFDMYLRSAEAPLLSSVPSVANDTLLPRAAYWATVSAYNAGQPDLALLHIDKAMTGADSLLAMSLQEYKVRCLEAQGLREQWLEQLTEGCRLYPQHNYFYLHLMDQYLADHMYDEGVALSERLLREVGDSAIYWYGASQMQLAKQDYDACIASADEALRLDSLMADAYYNKGMAFVGKAVAFAETACNDIRNPKCRQDRRTLQSLYRQAQEPMETLRSLSPADSRRWAPALYRIYLNLNMGREFADMEKILNAQ